MKRQLHKRHRDYTEAELRKIKTEHCNGCPHFKILGSHAVSTYATSKAKKAADETLKFNFMYCDYMHDTGSRRVCAAELCPCSVNKEGITLNEETHEKFVDFTTYCVQCKHRDCKDDDEPCNECLSHPTNYESMKPVKFEKKEN